MCESTNNHYGYGMDTNHKKPHLFEIAYTQYSTDDSADVIETKKNTTKLYQVASNTEWNALVEFGKRFNTTEVPYEFIVEVFHVKQVR